MIRACADADVDTIQRIINDAASAYRGVIPDDCCHDPYMSRDELVREIADGVAFSGWEREGTLIGVMGLQHVRGVTLIRHAYVRTGFQNQGIGGALLDACLHGVDRRVLVGTWAAATWAIRFYERHGFQLLPPDETDRLLTMYWRIPPRQRETSVVLESGLRRPSTNRLAVARSYP